MNEWIYLITLCRTHIDEEYVWHLSDVPLNHKSKTRSMLKSITRVIHTYVVVYKMVRYKRQSLILFLLMLWAIKWKYFVINSLGILSCKEKEAREPTSNVFTRGNIITNFWDHFPEHPLTRFHSCHLIVVVLLEVPVLWYCNTFLKPKSNIICFIANVQKALDAASIPQFLRCPNMI